MKRLLQTVLFAALGGCAAEPDARVARAIRIASETELLEGPTARGRIGDYKIWNDRVAFVLSDAGLADGYGRYGGAPVDADVVRPAGEAGGSQLGSLFFGFDQRLFEPERAQIAADGDGGETGDRAIVRFVGRDGFFPWFDALMGSLLPTGDIGLAMVYEYSLGPGDEALRLDITLKNQTGDEKPIDMVEAAFIAGDGLRPFFPGPGFDTGAQTGTGQAWLGMGERVSYGLFAEEGPLDMVFNISNVAMGLYPDLAVPAGSEVHLRRTLAVASGGLDEVQRILRALGTSDEPVGTLRCRVTADSAPRVHVQNEGGQHVTALRPEPLPEGGFLSAALLPAGHYQLVAKADGASASAPVPVEVTAGGITEAEFRLTSARLRYRIEDGSGKLVPGRLTFLGGPADLILGAAFGEESYPNRSALTIWSGSGEGESRLPPGDYEAIASRGFEYGQDRQTFSLGPEGGDLVFTVQAEVSSEGLLSGDFHVHARASPDSSIPFEFRLRTALAEGLDLFVLTEHDTIRDLTALVQESGYADLLQAAVGSEITTYIYGHFQAWPVTEKPDQLNRGGIDWYSTPGPELFARIRASETHPVVIQVNHPRSDAGGYFTSVGLDRAAGAIARPANWSEDFEALEVFNGGCANGDSEAKLDWYDLLSRGYKVSVSAGSDSHSEHAPLGVPRVVLPASGGPRDLDPAALVEVFVGQRVFVSCGPLVALRVDGNGLGETVTVQGGAVQAAVRVMAPAWMDLDQARLVVNGAVAWSTAIPAGSGVRLEQEVPLQVGSDAWVVLEVTGRGSIWPIASEKPYALTDPIYLDADGNGDFDPFLPKYRLGA